MKAKMTALPSGKESDLTLNKTVWEAPENKKLIAQYIRVYLTNQHQGTKQAKRRGDIDNPDKKPWRQKGTGRARHGSENSPIWVGGGKAHGPRPFTRRLTMSKQMRDQALRSALSSHAKNKQVQFFSYEAKANDKLTKAGLKLLQGMKLHFSKVGLIVSRDATSVRRMFANLPQVTLYSPEQVNPFNVSASKVLLVEAKALAELEKRLDKPAEST